MTDQNEPRLASPGAGLPAVELVAARLLFVAKRLLCSRRSCDIRFANERQRILELVRDCTPQQGARRVLIQRMAGLEDSSRYWSIWMTLDHLRIVHCSMADWIGELMRGVVPVAVTSIAAVKPRNDVGHEVLVPFEVSCNALASVVASSSNLRTKSRYSHPWFGPLNAADWYMLSGIHMGIHRRQIERILAGPASTPNHRM